MLIGGLITWTACVFLRAVAARTYLLRLELVPAPGEPDVEAAEAENSAGPAASKSPLLAEVATKRQHGKNGNTKPSGSPGARPTSHGKPSGNGNGHAKVPVKRSGR